MWDLIVSVPDHCLSFYFTTNLPSVFTINFPNGFRTILPSSFTINDSFKWFYSNFPNGFMINDSSN